MVKYKVSSEWSAGYRHWLHQLPVTLKCIPLHSEMLCLGIDPPSFFAWCQVFSFFMGDWVLVWLWWGPQAAWRQKSILSYSKVHLSFKQYTYVCLVLNRKVKSCPLIIGTITKYGYCEPCCRALSLCSYKLVGTAQSLPCNCSDIKMYAHSYTSFQTQLLGGVRKSYEFQKLRCLHSCNCD